MQSIIDTENTLVLYNKLNKLRKQKKRRAILNKQEASYYNELLLFFSKFSHLNDISYKIKEKNKSTEIYKLTNIHLEYFRNNPEKVFYQDKTITGIPYKKYRKSINKIDLFLHCNKKDNDTIYIINSNFFDTILMVFDVDAKNGETDAQELIEYLSKTYFNSQCYIEPSRGNSGRHGYIFINVKFISAKSIHDVICNYTKLIKLDPNLKNYKASFDKILGIPTQWSTNDKNLHSIAHRGCLVSLPYFRNGTSDFSSLKNLKPLNFSFFEDKLNLHNNELTEVLVDVLPPPLLSSKRLSSSDKTFTQKKSNISIDGLVGYEKKKICVSKLFRKLNCAPTLEETLLDYTNNYSPTGYEEQDISQRTKELQRLITIFTKTFIPCSSPSSLLSSKKLSSSDKTNSPITVMPFKKDEYLELIKKRVPEEAFKWKRREKLTYEKLSDFVSVKIQDAFYKKDNYIARTSRDATKLNFRVLKEKKLVNWIINNDMYTKLLQIATTYNLLEIYEEFYHPDTVKGMVSKGHARMIGPGIELKREYNAFQIIYNKFKGNIEEEKQPIMGKEIIEEIIFPREDNIPSSFFEGLVDPMKDILEMSKEEYWGIRTEPIILYD